MAPVATLVFIAYIAWLFWLDRDQGPRASAAVWIPTIWLLINGSRTVSTWMNRSSAVPLAAQYSEGSPLDAAIFALLILAGILVLNFRTRRVRELLQQNLPILLFFAYCGISVFWSAYSFIALKRWSKAIGDVVMILVVLTDPQPLQAIRRLFARATFLLLPISVLLIEFYPGLGSGFDYTDRVMMFIGVTTFKNLLGMVTMVLGLSAVWRFLEAYEDKQLWHRKRHLISHGLMILTALWLLVKCDSKTSLSCYGLSGVLLFLCTQPWVTQKRRRVHLLVATVIGIPLMTLFVSSFGPLIRLLGRKPNLTDRTLIWQAVLAMRGNPFVGTGFESFWLGSRLQSVWDLSVHGIQEAHNGYLEVYINLGWCGELLLILLIVTGYRNILKALRTDPNLGRLRLAFFTTALTYCLTEAGFTMMNPIWLVFLLAITNTAEHTPVKLRNIIAPVPAAPMVDEKRVRVLQ